VKQPIKAPPAPPKK